MEEGVAVSCGSYTVLGINTVDDTVLSTALVVRLEDTKLSV